MPRSRIITPIRRIRNLLFPFFVVPKIKKLKTFCENALGYFTK